MTVYVDEFKLWLPKQPRPFHEGSSHLSADTLDELHEFAQAIGMRRAWFQEHVSMPHYDLVRSRRDRALARGAVFVSARQQALARRARRLAETR